MSVKRKPVAALAAVLACGSVLGGCQGAALAPLALFEMMFPKDRVAPKFKLPGGKCVLVFPDDVLTPVSYPPAKRLLAKRVNDLLTEKKLAAKTIPYDELTRLKQGEADFNRLAVASVGRRLGADLVIYVNVSEFSLKD